MAPRRRRPQLPGRSAVHARLKPQWLADRERADAGKRCSGPDATAHALAVALLQVALQLLRGRS
jgi:hypothetical protein